ncbi:MAG: GNAT family N-acetyltransferase [Solirubrobacterales bacterium]|nr:GNAT family N-acetyltransferase [Solirubrobacterales bacterium]
MRNPITVRRRDPTSAHSPLRLPHGARVLIRPIREDDAEGYARAFTRLSAESRRRRFLSAISRLSPRDLRYLTAVDQHEHVALVAVEPGAGETLGSVRYVRIAGGRADAELAIEVIDEWQRRGVGRALLEALSAHARANGLSRFTALVAADNRPMQRALKRAVLDVEEDYGELEYLLDVDALTPPSAPGPRRATHRGREVTPRPAFSRAGIQPAARPA